MDFFFNSFSASTIRFLVCLSFMRIPTFLYFVDFPNLYFRRIVFFIEIDFGFSTEIFSESSICILASETIAVGLIIRGVSNIFCSLSSSSCFFNLLLKIASFFSLSEANLVKLLFFSFSKDVSRSFDSCEKEIELFSRL